LLYGYNDGNIGVDFTNTLDLIFLRIYVFIHVESEIINNYTYMKFYLTLLYIMLFTYLLTLMHKTWLSETRRL